MKRERGHVGTVTWGGNEDTRAGGPEGTRDTISGGGPRWRVAGYLSGID